MGPPPRPKLSAHVGHRWKRIGKCTFCTCKPGMRLGQFPAYNVHATQEKLATALDTIVDYVHDHPELFKEAATIVDYVHDHPELFKEAANARHR